MAKIEKSVYFTELYLIRIAFGFRLCEPRREAHNELKEGLVALQVNSSNVSMPFASQGSDVAFASQRGKVARTDQTSLNLALSSINSTLSASENSGDRMGPVDLKLRIDALIDAQISGGILSDKQAAVLRAYFGTGVAAPEETDEVPPPPPPPPPVESVTQTGRPEKRPEAPYPGARPDTKDPLDPIAVFIQKLRNESPTGYNGYNSLSGASSARRDPVLLDITA